MNGGDPYYFFLGAVFFYAAAFPITDILCRAFSDKFKRFDHDRQYYIISNVLKSVMLSFVALMFTFVVAVGILNPFYITGFTELRIFMVNTSTLYSVTDIVSLILNYKAQAWSTRFHHLAVAFACWKIYVADFDGEGIYKGMMMYGAYSALAAPVNTYLGMRFLVPEKATWYLKKMALYSYITSCFINWTWQGYYLLYLGYLGLTEGDYMLIAKMALLATMIYVWMSDDYVLIAHLRK